MAKYKPRKTPEEEFDEIFSRISGKITFPEDTLKVTTLIDFIDENYPLNQPKEHKLYKEMGKRGKDDVIAKNVKEYIKRGYSKHRYEGKDYLEKIIETDKLMTKTRNVVRRGYTPAGKPRLYVSLIQEFGRENVERALAEGKGVQIRGIFIPIRASDLQAEITNIPDVKEGDNVRVSLLGKETKLDRLEYDE